ncbi:MAG TPA: hypothetical protein VLW53_22890 [Candidatus Eisenbacteria bacterium]|nr:hypothetical protein [Candidatus Eisenbacteria bacterium]
MNDQLRHEIREMVEGFGPPRPGLAARAMAGLPERRRRTRPAHWLVPAAAVVAIAATVLLVWTVRTARQTGTLPASVAELQRRPLAAVPLVGPSCQVDARRAKVRQTAGGVTYVSASGVPMDELMTVQIASKPAAKSTIGVAAGPRVSGPVLVRGHRLDGPGTIRLGPAPAAPSQTELAFDVTPRTRHKDVTIDAGAGGCYAIQFDGTDFSEQAVVLLYSSPGALEPGGATMNAARVGPAVRAATRVRPVLLPTAVVGSEWRAAVETAPDGFSVEYDDPTVQRSVFVSVGGGPLPFGATVEQAPPRFRGDPGSRYQASDSDPLGARILTWQESSSGVRYTLSARGLSDAEFWQVANSLR